MALWKYGRFLGESQITLTRPPFETTNKWENLCLPADHATNKLDKWHQKNADSYGTPWASLAGAPSVNSLIGTVAQFIVNSGTSIQLHLGDTWSTTSSDNLHGNFSESNWTINTGTKIFAFEFYLDNDQEEESASVIYDDDETFWTGTGDATVSEELTIKTKGTSSLKIVTTGAGTARHNYGAGQDWSASEFICWYWYGSNSGDSFTIHLYAPTAGNRFEYTFTDNFIGWKRFVKAKAHFSSVGSPSWADVALIDVNFGTAGTWYLDRLILDVGQWVKTEVYVPDATRATSYDIRVFSWNGSIFSVTPFTSFNAGTSTHVTWSSSELYFLDTTTGTTIYSSPGNCIGEYPIGLRGSTKSVIAGGGGNITFSSNYGCKTRIGFALKMPPDDGQDSSTAGISQCRLKLEIYYDDDGDVTYEFEDSAQQFYGLQNINKQYIALFKDDVTGLVDFLELKAGLSINALTVKANHNNEIGEVVIGFSGVTNSKEVFWGQSDENPATETDNIPDVITNIEALVDGGGY